MSEILDKMQNSDVIVFATPIYFYTMCAQMKTFIDRMCSRYTRISNKDFYYIMTSADGNKNCMNRTVEEFRGLLACLDNPTEKGILQGVGVWQKGEVNSTAYPKIAYDMGANV
jgi:multimeric flavodoxin WrbA